eukprot:CAMPEP_0198722970 /NCGR_PEP_ID=MMETSP1475-20131203/550_1 /TAXON_ID= ORGANISM="Unidentified sp., Strain CCMP1999" /NCGR_SAMPLE_ID=MMETSP1475 /ASSEMBLY_ACC=CAM_ASM_001111 /LENGTH=41 /DNA_ID= /DNA_START= /DNA_END= /DNA_ORIENTATION=
MNTATSNSRNSMFLAEDDTSRGGSFKKSLCLSLVLRDLPVL